MKRVSIAFFVISLLAVPGALVGQQPNGSQPNAPAIRLEPRPCALMALRFIRSSLVPRLTRDLGLTDEQATRASELLSKADEKMSPLIEEQRRATEEFARALAKPDSSHAALVAAFEKAMKTETALASELIKTLFALRDLLNDQQKEQFNKLVEMQTRPWTREAVVSGSGSQPTPAPGAQSPAPTQPGK
ncbi:MAG: Spy/CpxP family protein refolding chaperone [Armatimonadota bacterium]